MTLYVILTGLFFAGAIVGAFGWDAIVTDRVRDRFDEHRERSASSIEAWRRIAVYAEQNREATMLALTDNGDHSRKVVPLRGVS